MNRILLGLLCGLGFGIVDIILMLPMKFEDKRKKIEAILGAFLERFVLGFIIPNIQLGISPIITGGILGLGLSLPTSIITRAYIPINAIGIIGGIIIGLIVNFVAI
jgi:hypothetical protein